MRFSLETGLMNALSQTAGGSRDVNICRVPVFQGYTHFPMHLLQLCTQDYHTAIFQGQGTKASLEIETLSGS